MTQHVFNRRSTFLILDQALLDKVDALSGAILEHFFLKLRLLMYDGRVEAKTCAARKVEGRQPCKYFISKDAHSKNVSLLCDKRCDGKSQIGLMKGFITRLLNNFGCHILRSASETAQPSNLRIDFRSKAKICEFYMNFEGIILIFDKH